MIPFGVLQENLAEVHIGYLPFAVGNVVSLQAPDHRGCIRGAERDVIQRSAFPQDVRGSTSPPR